MMQFLCVHFFLFKKYNLESVRVNLMDEDFGRSSEQMGYIELFRDAFQFVPVQWLPVLQGQGEVREKEKEKKKPSVFLIAV